MNKTPFQFADALLTWFDEHGRKHLPWQHPITPYRVWLSEVMLQQTQVDTVIPYFERFIARYHSVDALAQASLDEVLQLWTGLGYYARARNLHKCAQQVCAEHKGEFPSEVESLILLPGIGRSTACAIASIAFGKSTAILDGNVKRVLTRFHAVGGWPGHPKVEAELWQHAQHHMPETRCGDYSQAIMDLGATLCVRSRPRCNHCPMRSDCRALEQNEVELYPGKKPKKVVPVKSTIMLIASDTRGRLFLEQRPPQGIWGGLWSFKEYESTEQALTYARTLGPINTQESWAQVRHVFSHYKLDITPLVVTVSATPSASDGDGTRWQTLEGALQLGLAAPVKRLIENLQQSRTKLL